MATPKSGGSSEILSNFRASSRRRGLEPASRETAASRVPPQCKPRQYLINGVDFYSQLAVVNREVEATQDVFSVKGDYLYIRKGTKVVLGSAIGQYCQITLNGHTGYFPSYLFRHV